MKHIFLVMSLCSSVASVAQPVWQQLVDTKIDVKLNDEKHKLNGYIEISYTNNSPDTLRNIYFHLWPNAYLHDHTPFAKQQEENGNTAFYYSSKEDRGYMDEIQFSVNGQSTDHFITESAPDIAKLDLKEPLLPGKMVKITTPFMVKLPIVFSRNGHTGQAYYVSQWFPKPAVYDQKGWHPMSYLDQGEFYSEYGSYDVSITLPENYVLMATGNCTDEQELAWMDARAKDTLPSDTLFKHSTPPSAVKTKTVHYHEENIHDFAWFADKRWLLRKDTVRSPGSNELITTWAAFLPGQQKAWAKATGYLNETVKHYGKWVGPYPYKTMKAVQGDMKSGGGMEYPTITLIDKTATGSLRTVVVHEGGHNWFYGMLGSNEREHPWMDEGLNSFYEQKTVKAIDTAKGKARKLSKWNETLIYHEFASTGSDQAIELPSEEYGKINYGVDVYYKTAMMLGWLEEYMGSASFEAGIKGYFQQWRFHHPYPDDFRKIMEQHATKPIGWFFDSILTMTNRLDFRIKQTKVHESSTDVRVINRSGIAAPVGIRAYTGDSLLATTWSAPFLRNATVTLPVTNWTKLTIDELVPDSKQANNVYRRQGPFHKFGLQLRPFFGLNTYEKHRVFVTPAIGHNRYDGFMAGVAIHNFTIPETRFRFAIAPMYGFRSESITGGVSAGYAFYPGGSLREVLVQADAKTYHYNEVDRGELSTLRARYAKLAPSVTFTFRQPVFRSPVTRMLTLKAYHIVEGVLNNVGDTTGKVPYLSNVENQFGLARYSHQNRRAFNPFGYSLEGQYGKQFAKLNLEGNLRIDYNKKNKSLHIRAYIGKMFVIAEDPSLAARYQLNASYSGINDYLYDGTYKGRYAQNRLSAQQLSMQEGGFKIPVFNNAYRTDNWMATINLKTDLPLKSWPVRLFFDAGLLPNPTPGFANISSTQLMFDGGVELHMFKDLVCVYFPLMMSSGFQNYITDTYGHKNLYTRSISFTLNIQNINCLKITDNFIKRNLN